jgi:ribosomal protein L12E/L44/L45/RPP1/RPP2
LQNCVCVREGAKKEKRKEKKEKERNDTGLFYLFWHVPVTGSRSRVKGIWGGEEKEKEKEKERNDTGLFYLF